MRATVASGRRRIVIDVKPDLTFEMTGDPGLRGEFEAFWKLDIQHYDPFLGYPVTRAGMTAPENACVYVNLFAFRNGYEATFEGVPEPEPEEKGAIP